MKHLRIMALLPAATLICLGSLAASCDSDGDDAGSGGSSSSTSSNGSSSGTGGSSTSSSGSSSGTGGIGASSGCDALPASTGNIIDVDPSQTGQLQALVAAAAPGDTFLLADGTYALDGSYLWISAEGVTIRGASGDREAVILDGNYQTTEIITVAASDVTIADLTIREAYTHPIHVTTTPSGDTTGTVIYNVHIIDPREQAIKINPSNSGSDGTYTDGGLVACSRIEMTDEGRLHPDGCYTGGVDAHQSWGWVIRDNVFEGFWCDTGLSEHAVHCWRGCRDTVVERNVMIDNARGIGFGLSNSGDARVYDDDPCPGVSGYVGHYGGIARNNFIFASDAGLLSSEYGFDCGVCFSSACDAQAIHNTVVSTGGAFSSIEWRFATSTGVEITNNLVTDPLRERDGASGVQAGNVEDAPLSLFADGPGGDLHLNADATAAIDQGVSLAAGLCDDDIDGEQRDETPDVGADEVP